MKRTFFHLIMPAIAGVMLFGLVACNPDVQLGYEENIPEVAEHILGMTKQTQSKQKKSRDNLASCYYLYIL